MAECAARWRSWGERRPYQDIDGKVHSLGWNEPKRERPRCGARTRAAGSCRAPAVTGKERCRMHGGLATGPKTPEGKARSIVAAREGYRRWRNAQKAGGSAHLIQRKNGDARLFTAHGAHDQQCAGAARALAVSTTT
jgi:hypothetical protein